MGKATADLVARVQKLLALSTSQNVHEAAAAAARAQELIDRHQLHDAVKGVVSDDDDDPISDGRAAPLESAQRPRRFRKVLAEGLAALNGGVAWTFDDDDGTHLCFCGRDSDRAVTRALFLWLAQQLEWLSATAGPGKPKSWHEAFRVGAADVVVDRLVRGDTDDVRDSAALVVVDAARAARAERVARWAKAHLPRQKNKGFLVDARGFQKGKEAAQALPLASTPQKKKPRA